MATYNFKRHLKLILAPFGNPWPSCLLPLTILLYSLNVILIGFTVCAFSLQCETQHRKVPSWHYEQKAAGRTWILINDALDKSLIKKRKHRKLMKQKFQLNSPGRPEEVDISYTVMTAKPNRKKEYLLSFLRRNLAMTSHGLVFYYSPPTFFSFSCHADVCICLAMFADMKLQFCWFWINPFFLEKI